MVNPQTFHVVLIKPARYDDQGYVIQWVRYGVPLNSLAVLNSLVMDCGKRKVLGDGVQFVVETYDESGTVLPIQAIIRNLKGAARGFVGLVGVQTNQFPRAVDLSIIFLNAGIPVILGGFHVSGSLAMLPEIPTEVQAAITKGITIFAGEAEDHIEELVQDVYYDRLKPLYNYLNDLPDLEGRPMPFLPPMKFKGKFGVGDSFDAGRGCPFQCSFCTIINVQGRKSRSRSPDDIEALIRGNYPKGIKRYFITDDDFARNKNWESILDRMIKLKYEEGLGITFTIQVDVLSHRIPRFVEKAAMAGCRSVFIGLESVNPQALISAKKRQNKVSEYRTALLAWKDHGCLIFAGYILGFPGDTLESISRDIETVKRELPVDLAIFFMLTPLPGSEDHQKLFQQGVWMDPDLNKYDDQHITISHPLMSAEEWQLAYDRAWEQFYGLEHAETILRREGTKKSQIKKLQHRLMFHYGCATIERVHPHEGGLLRRKLRHMRRPGMPIESPLIFYPRRLWEFLSNVFQWGILYWKFHRIAMRVSNDPNRKNYMDLALTPVAGHGNEDGGLADEESEIIPLIQLGPTHEPVSK